MSKILFRGKRVDNGKWIKGDLIQGTDGRKYIVTLCDNTGTWTLSPRLLISEVDSETVGQFSGLVAKGKKIFDGDICKRTVRRSDEWGDGQGYTAQAATKFWNETQIRAITLDPECRFGFELITKHDEKTLEIVGNIHDNPEILEGEPLRLAMQQP